MKITFFTALFFFASSVCAKPFGIHVIDDATGRGVPLVELASTSKVKLYTDSAGWIALDDPALLGRHVYFDVKSHGYECPADGFGSRGVALDVTDGGEAQVKIKRLNIAERLYRITGEGIYRDSVMLAKPVPIAQPLLNGRVTGQDSAQCAVYRGKLWWFFGDTNDQAYKMGHFSTSGATSNLPGLDPALGVNLAYFTRPNGFARAMIPPNGGELHWLDGLLTVNDDAGNERMVAAVTRLKTLGKINGRHLAAFNDDAGVFEPIKELEADSHTSLRGHPFRHTVDGVEYYYFGDAYPNLRVRADWKSVTDPSTYEAYTPSEKGWTWVRGGKPFGWREVERKITAGEWKADDVPFRLCDASKKPVHADSGSVCWNEYRKRWVMIAVESGGSRSMLGEVWYAEAAAPEGPWREATKIVTHEKYSFYNPLQHAVFFGEGGRFVYFEGTYATTFSRDDEGATPRYDYNQMMYRVDLSDPRLQAVRREAN